MSSPFDTLAVDGEAFNESAFSNFSSATVPPSYGSGSLADDEITVDHASQSVNGSDPFGFGADPSLNYSESSTFTSSVPHANGNGTGFGIGKDDGGVFSSDGPVLPPPGEMQEEGSAIREWRRENAILLGEKEMKEKEVRNQIVEEAIDFKNAFYEKRKIHIESNRSTNREKEKLYAANQEKFHKAADKDYWKTIGEIIPREVPNIEKKRGNKKDQENKPSIIVIQGPKPGKPTDLSRMRHLLLKLKHTPPPHMIQPQPTAAKDDGKVMKDAPAAPVAPQTAILV